MSSQFIKESLKSKIVHDETNYFENRKLLQQSAQHLAGNLEKYDIDTLLVIFLLSIDISKDYRCDLLNTKLIEMLIARSKESFDFNTRFGMEPSPYIFKYLSNDKVDNIKAEGVHLIYMFGSFHHFQLEELLKQHFDFFSVSINSYLIKYSIEQLLLLAEHITQLHKFDRCSVLFQKCIAAICDLVEQGGTNLPTTQYTKILKQLGHFGGKNSFLTKRLNNLISSSISNDSSTNFGELHLSTMIEERYKIAKNHLDLLHTFLLTGLFENGTIIESLLTSIMKFCLFYFQSTSKICRTNPIDDIPYNYNIESKFSSILYAKYPNKVLRSQPMEFNDKRVPEDSNDRFLMIEAALSRLLFSNEMSFCRKLKHCEIYIRTFYPSIYRNISGDLQKFMTSISLHKYKDTGFYSHYDHNLYNYLRKLDYKPCRLIVDNIFPINCLDHKRKLFIEILEKCDIYHEKMLDFKLKYLCSLGWNSVIINHSDWIDLPEESRIRLLREKINSIST
ncbi:conserved hypothetical protein [Theileria equi strain WA]|uniref:RAP domain-containing protein n=1 Tax=Theileria equi strain WA TaxID=1537102 RepID=L1LG99_THEEQ|nr:conserved hypothetical protein [Theileria equi strain WA]EKX74265.1 conserved hypothetical protein [Theileria equi strain WA]|eukprot:XP_004833717.1 conserved hypothetical protein [Theileria equi strain WA]